VGAFSLGTASILRALIPVVAQFPFVRQPVAVVVYTVADFFCGRDRGTFGQPFLKAHPSAQAHAELIAD